MCGQGLRRERSATQSRNEAAQHQTEKRDDTPEPQEIREDKTKKGASRELWRSQWRGEKMKYQRTEIERGGEKKSKLCRDCEPGLNSFPLFQEVTVFRQKKNEESWFQIIWNLNLWCRRWESLWRQTSDNRLYATKVAGPVWQQT